ncbi:MAG: phosphatase PAP2 family protein [Bacteroidetes bacterium]|nr:phosphatase PAP2 family protein [Bacteroidota bacterium]
MRKIYQENKDYFMLLAIFIVVGGVYLVETNKADFIFFFSENRHPWADVFFKSMTRLGEGPVYFVVAIAALTVRLRYTLLVAATGLSVMGVSAGLKPLFAIDRPLAFFTKQHLIENVQLVGGVDLHSGPTSFPSGHAMSAFALYSLLIFLLPSQKRFVVFFFSLALLVAVSRIYLVQHFWPDVYAGGIIGAVLAMAVYAVHSKYELSDARFLDRPLIGRNRNAVIAGK